MEPDHERVSRLQELMAARGLTSLVCQFPHNVLMLSGYRPVLGESIAIMLRDGRVFLIVPESEAELAARGWAGQVQTFEAMTLEYILDSWNVKRLLLTGISHELCTGSCVVGYEGACETVPASYIEMQVGAAEAHKLYHSACPEATFIDATDVLEEAASILTERELQLVKHAALMGEAAFESAKLAVQERCEEREVAGAGLLALRAAAPADAQGLVGAVFAMSGPSSERAYLPYQYATDRHIADGDLVVVHLNAQYRGFWTDLTRTFIAGEPSDEKSKAYESVLRAREAAIGAVADGVRAAAVDAAARQVLTEAGWGKAFRHGAGHGVGYKAIYHGTKPVLHPLSEDVIANGMSFNIEPAVYAEDFGGMRISDVVAVRNGKPEVLSGNIPTDMEWVVC